MVIDLFHVALLFVFLFLLLCTFYFSTHLDCSPPRPPPVRPHLPHQTPQGRKGKTQKHTAKEIAAKTKAAKERGGAAGGAGAGKAARLAVMANQNVTCEGKLTL